MPCNSYGAYTCTSEGSHGSTDGCKEIRAQAHGHKRTHAHTQTSSALREQERTAWEGEMGQVQGTRTAWEGRVGSRMEGVEAMLSKVLLAPSSGLVVHRLHAAVSKVIGVVRPPRVLA